MARFDNVHQYGHGSLATIGNQCDSNTTNEESASLREAVYDYQINHCIVHAVIMNAKRNENLSDRLCGIMLEIARGETIKSIADTYRVSTKTIEYHIARLRKQLNIKGNLYSELTKHAIRLGYINV